MIAHLTGQERALEPFGWTGRQAEWIALACLPIEPETVGSFEALGIERRILPIRAYRGDARNTRRYFPLK